SVSLAVDKAFQDASANAGTSGHTFTVKVTNNGPSDAVGIHLTDGVDNRLNVSSFSDHGTGQDCAASTGQNLDCTFDLANGASKTVTVTYAVASSVAPATVSNTATASAAGATTVQSTDTVVVKAAADVTIS